MPDLAEQIRLYIDETMGAEREVDPVYLPEPPSPRIGRSWLLVAALVLAIAAVGAVLVVNQAGDDVETDAVTDDGVPDSATGPVTPRPSGVRGTTLDWKMGAVPEDGQDFPQLLSDGKNLYWIGDRIHMSTDGSTWTTAEFEAGSEPLIAGIPVVDGVWAGRLIITHPNDIAQREIPVRIAGLDGSLDTTDLPLPGADSGDGPPPGASDIAGTIGPRGAIVTAVDATDSRLGWHTSDGIEWTAIHDAEPFATNDSGVLQITAIASGFVAVDGQARVWHASDGLEWTRVDGDAASVAGARLLAWDDRALLAGVESGFVAFAADGIDQLIPDADRPSVFGNSIGAGHAGIAYLVPLDPDGNDFELVYSPDGVAWERQKPPTGTGDIYCCFLDAWGVVVGSEQVALLSRTDAGFELWLGTPLTEEEQE